MILTYLKIEFKVITNINIIYFISVIFNILFTSILELPEDVKPKFYKEYM